MSPSVVASRRAASLPPRLVMACALALALCPAAALGAPVNVRPAAPERLSSWSLGHEAALQDYFDRHAATFGLRPGVDRLRLEREHSLPGTRHARLQQTWRGLPVLGGECTVSLGGDGDVRLVLGSFIEGISADVTLRVSEGAARAAALARLPGSAGDYDTESRLAVVRRAGADRLVYEVRAGARRNPVARQILVDAASGAVLEETDLALRVTGSGCIYRLNPDTLDFETVPFQRLAGDGTVLSGSSSRVHNSDPAAVPDAWSAASTFCFPPQQPDTTNFDQANVYWHIDHLVGDVFGGFGYPGPRSPFPVTVTPAGPPGSNPGVTSLVWDVPTIWFGSIQITLQDGSRPVRDGAKEASIVYHEATHAVMGDIGIKPGEDPEAAAIHEGTADYFAAAVTGTPALGPWTYGTGGATRQDTDPAVYNYNNTWLRNSGVYQAGQIWSGALWDMRTDPEIGPVIDGIVFRSFYYMPAHPSFATAATAVLQADHDLRGGADSSAIVRVLARRGIQPGGTVTAWIEGPGRIVGAHGDVCGTWWAHMALGQRPYLYEWKQYVKAPGYWTWRVVGVDSVLTACGPADFDLALRVVDAQLNEAGALFSVTVVDTAPPPLRIALTGPSTLRAGDLGTYSAVPSGGMGDRTLLWWKSYGDGRPNVGLGGAPNGCNAGTCWVQVWDDTSFVVNVRVTDTAGHVAMAAVSVTVTGATPLVASIVGPDTVTVFAPCQDYRGRASGGLAPYLFEWHQFERFPGDFFWHDAGSDSVARVCGRSGFDLWLSVRDARGRNVSVYKTVAYRDTAPRPVGLALFGPQVLVVGQPATFTAIASGGDSPRVFTWWKSYLARPDTGVPSDCGASADSCSVTTADSVSFMLHARVTEGQASAETALAVTVNAAPLAVTLRGDKLVALGETGRYTAATSGGRPPYAYQWLERHCDDFTRSSLESSGTYDVAPRPADCGCPGVAVTVAAFDADARTARDSLGMSVSCVEEAFSFTVSGDGAAPGASWSVVCEVRSPQPDVADLAIHDLLGRRVVVLHRGPLPAGRSTFVWSAADAPCGVYFARLATARRTLTRRVVIVR